MRLRNCQLCGPSELTVEKSGGPMGGRYETRAVSAIAAAIRECCCPLREIVLSENRIRDPEMATLMAAVGERSQHYARREGGDGGGLTPLALDFTAGATVKAKGAPGHDANDGLPTVMNAVPDR